VETPYVEALAAALALAALANAARPEPIRLPDGRTLELICTGDGGPTVILESGLGLPMETWQRVQSKLAVTQRTCAYSRAGYPGSDAGPMPRDARRAAQDLADMLASARLPGPYVLVGHSLGADVVRVYAAAHPHEVKGLVLLDPAIPDEARRIGAVSPNSGRVNKLNEEISRLCIGAVAREAIWTASDPAFEPCGPPPPPGPASPTRSWRALCCPNSTTSIARRRRPLRPAERAFRSWS
jgi:pimeloyl-ACP methyl ester carboxylesterase